MENKAFVKKLNRLDACTEAVEYVKTHGGTSAECWQDCKRGDWMAWLAAKTPSITHRQLVGALADCAALSLQHYEAKYPDDKRVRECINTCRRYANGKATDKELRDAASAAHAASATSAAAFAAYAAASVASAASASAASAASAFAAAAAAASAAYAAASAAYAAARKETLKQCADIFRTHFPNYGDAR